MTFLAPLGLLAGLLALPIIALHILTPRRQDHLVSSLMLWRANEAPVKAIAPWQRLRNSIPLILQLLTVLLLALALGAFALLRAAPLPEHTVFIIDGSGSMSADDGRPDRIGAAEQRVMELIEEVPSSGRYSLVSATASPTVLVERSNNPDEMARALRSIEIVPAGADFTTAFLLAESLDTADGATGYVLLTDGGLTTTVQGLAPAGTRVEFIGDSEANRAVSTIGVKPVAGGLDVRVGVVNTGGGASTETLRLEVDGITVERREITIADGAVSEEEFAAPEGSQVSAHLEGADLMPVDNHRYAVVPRPDEVRVSVEGESSFFVEQLLEALGAEEVASAETADVMIYNQVAVPPAPELPFIAITPPSGAPGIDVIGSVEAPVPSYVADDPLLEAIDVSRIGLAKAQELSIRSGEVLLSGASGPLLIRGSDGPVPFFYLSFALEQSNLPVEVAFPVLGARMIDELTAVDSLGSGFTAGDRVPATFSGELTDPRGTSQTISSSFGAARFDLPGFWNATGEDGVATVVAVNPDISESALRVPAELEAIPTGGLVDEAGAQAGALTAAESLVRWLAIAALVVISLEFLWWLARSGVRALPNHRLAAALRAVVLLLLVLAIVNPGVSRSSDEVATVFVVDTSASVTAEGLSEAQAMVEQSVTGDRPSNSRYAIVGFDRSATIEVAMSAPGQLTDATADFRGQTLGDASDIGQGLRMASSVLNTTGGRRVVLITDGRSLDSVAATEIDRLRQLGIVVDVMSPQAEWGVDFAVTALSGPVGAEPDTVVDLTARVVATTAGPATLVLRDGDEVVETKTVDLEAGENDVEFSVAVGAAGIQRYSVTVAQADDTNDRNNSAETAIEVLGRSSVLVVASTVDTAAPVAEGLEANGLDVETLSTVPSLDDLWAYQSLVLVDVPAEDLSGTQVEAISGFVRDLGRGLVVIGGQNSYGLGDYQDTALEDLLPVESSVTDIQREASIAEVLLIDVSESMGACHCAPSGEGGMEFQENEGPNKTDISRAAAAKAIEALDANDEIGVLAFNARHDWILPLGALPSEQAITEGLSQLKPIGETRIGQALTAAAESLLESQKELKHIILFTDGFTPELPESQFMFGEEGLTEQDKAMIKADMERMREEMGLGDLHLQAEELAEKGITISVVATGEGAIPELEQIAEIGNGRFYPGRNLDEIPEIFVKEARLAARSMINEGEYVPAVVGVSPVTAGLSAAPPLKGYVATTAKSKGQTLLAISEFRDPLLATWRIGLGRATAWTSDAGRQWGTDWAAWEGNPDFWVNVVRDTFPLSGSDGMRVRTQLVGDEMEIVLETEEEPPTGTEVVGFVGRPGGDRAPGDSEIRLERSDDGTFRGRTDAVAEGTYTVGLQIGSSAEEEFVASASATALVTRSYPAEFVPSEPDPEALIALSEATDGRGFITPDQAFDREGLKATDNTRRFRWLWLLGAALLWPLDIAARRLGFGWEQFRSLPERGFRRRFQPPSRGQSNTV